MAEALKDIKDAGQEKDKGQVGESERSDRTKERIDDLLGKLDATSKERDSIKQERDNLKFDLEFEKFSQKYPNAKDFRENIRKSVAAGISTEDAVILELHKSGKLQTNQEVQKDKVANDSIGGSADIKGVKDKVSKPNSEKTSTEMREELVELERKGEFRLTP